MGILADLFVADPADASSYEASIGGTPPAGRFEVRQLGGFTQLELEILWAILDGEEWSPTRYSLETVGEPSESTWLCRFPAPFVERLTRLAPAELPALATKWGTIEELSCSGDEIRPVLEALVALARSAVAKRRALLLWGSL